MADMLGYLDWRGDVPFSVSPFNEVDALLLAELSYFPAEGTVSKDMSEPVSLKEAYSKFKADKVPEEVRIISFEQDVELMRKMSESRRFADMKIAAYTNVINPSIDLQFAALTCIMDDFIYVSFRGTDGSIAGWKEDCNISFMDETAAQCMAVEYVKKHLTNDSRPLVLGGHSKGGNLAVYAAAFCPGEIQQRVSRIYSFDGPGFKDEITSSEGYKAVSRKIISVIPQSSLVGQLLSSSIEHRIVKSTASGIMQHLAYSWQVEAHSFDYAEELSKTGVFINRTMSSWLSSMDDNDRQTFVDAVFGVLEASDSETFKGMHNNRRKSFAAIIKALKALSPEQQAAAKKALAQLASQGKKALLAGLEEEERLQKRPAILEKPLSLIDKRTSGT